MTILILLISFCLFWTAMSWFSVKFSGWLWLQTVYVVNKPIEGTTFYNEFIGTNFSSFRALVIINEEGIYISPFFLMIFHRPIFIPWSEIDTCKLHFRLLNLYSIQTKKATRVEIYIKKSLLAKIEDNLHIELLKTTPAISSGV